MKKEFPEYILIKLRGANDYETDDKSNDDELQELTPLEAFKQVIHWELGDPAWADSIINWMEDCGFKIEEKANEIPNC